MNGKPSRPAINIENAVITHTQPRASGLLRVGVKNTNGRNTLDELHQKGSLKALFPRSVGKNLEVVFLNTAGGVTGRDQCKTRFKAHENAAMTISTQAAERAYKAHQGEIGVVEASLEIASGGRINWLPQETILFDHAALHRRLNITLQGDAEVLLVEPLIFGRQAMGETVTQVDFKDNWRIKRDGRLIYADATAIKGNAVNILAQPAVANGAIAMASVVFAAPNAERHLAPIRKALGPTAGVSLIEDGLLAARILAPDSHSLRKILIPVIQILTGHAIPKVWTL